MTLARSVEVVAVVVALGLAHGLSHRSLLLLFPLPHLLLRHHRLPRIFRCSALRPRLGAQDWSVASQIRECFSSFRFHLPQKWLLVVPG